MISKNLGQLLHALVLRGLIPVGKNLTLIE